MAEYEEILKEIEAAYYRCETAAEFSREIQRIWAEQGLVQGEWSCKMEEAGLMIK